MVGIIFIVVVIVVVVVVVVVFPSGADNGKLCNFHRLQAHFVVLIKRAINNNKNENF